MMSQSATLLPPTSGRSVRSDRALRIFLGGFVALSLPFLSPDQALSRYANAFFGPLTLGVALALVAWTGRALESAKERRFWFLVSGALAGLWLGGGAVALASETASLPWLVMTDVFYLGFYMLMAVAALSAPHRPEAEPRRLAVVEILGLGILLIGLLAYFVLLPSNLDAAKYRTWVPSMLLFEVLDVLLIFLFGRLLLDAACRRWRRLYVGILAAVAIWTALDMIESAGYSGWLALPKRPAFDLLWSLPILIVVIASRASLLSAGPSERRRERTRPQNARVANVALAATIAFPVVHLLLSAFGRVDPALQQARDLVVLASVLVLGLMALVERAQVQKARELELVERETAERALRESEARYRALVEHAPEAIVIFDPEPGVFVGGNDRALDLFKVSHDQLLRSRLADFSPSVQPNGRPSAEVAAVAISRALEGENPSFEWVHRNALGEYHHCEVFLTAYPWSGRQVVRGSMIDITDQLELREQLRQSQRMESIGQLAGGVAHDFNNLLTVISGYCDLALTRPELGPGLRKELEEIRRAGGSAAALTSQLLAFSRRQVLELAPMDLNRVVEGMQEMLARLIGEDLEFEFELGPDVPLILADAGQVVQIIMNLATNARDAMPAGGVLSLQTSMVEVRAGDATSLEGEAERFGQLVVSDTGQGMDDATRERVFEPFFTTKNLGQGTGLGLATVYGIVTQSGGSIAVESVVGEGTRFTVRFPVAEEVGTAASASPEPRVTAPHGDETVLLLEDERGVRELLRTGLAALGYRVLTAADADEALAVVAEQGSGTIDVLVSDVVLPGRSGPEVADEVRALRPEIRVIFISGYTDDLLARKGGLRPDEPLVQKPFTAVALARTVRSVLDRSASGDLHRGPLPTRQADRVPADLQLRG
jgi:PAS domain S-box-containing protein